MANNKPKAPTLTSCRGTFRFPKLDEIDFGTKEFPKSDGEYSVTLVVQASDPKAQAMIAKLQPLYEQAAANADTQFKALKAESRKKLGAVKMNPLYTELLDQDTEEPTGDLTFKFAVKASGQYKKGPKTGQFWDTRPTIFDADGKTVLIKGFRFQDRGEEESITDVHVKAKPGIWGGTEGKVSFEVGLDKDGNPGYFIPGTGAGGLKLSLAAAQVIKLVSAGERSGSSYGFGNETDEDDDDGETTQAPASADDEDTADF